MVSLGVGGELLLMRARNTIEPEEETVPGWPTLSTGPTLTNRWSHMSPQVSLNFGSGDGLSYLTGGLGWSKLTMERDDEPQDPGGRVRTLNYGGGAKWFAKKHLAFHVRSAVLFDQRAGGGAGPGRHQLRPRLRFHRRRLH